MKFTIVLGLQIIILFQLQAQNATIINAGTIEFQKKVNIHAVVDDIMALDPASRKDLEGIKTHVPAFYTQQFILAFNNTSTSYKQVEEANKIPLLFLKKLVIYSNLEKKTRLAEKNIQGQKFLIADSMRKIQWRITNETRTIAGFECRRANALIFDTVYVVAFFTSEIAPPGGPDAFNGLPGMILQVNLPHEHISWTAQKLSLQVNEATDIVPSSGNKFITAEDLYNTVINISRRDVLRQLLIKQLTL